GDTHLTFHQNVQGPRPSTIMAPATCEVRQAVIPEALLYLASWRPWRDMEPAPRRLEENHRLPLRLDNHF
ncbi:MAG: hypothetical protein OEV56_04920, partial [Dehalococcoidia bacterium]|nr:hypothetical protein [Dehalococcoidia bacterium]